MPSKLAQKIVQSNSKQFVTESFDTAIWEILSPKLMEMKNVISSRFLREAVDSEDDLQDAIDYVIDCMNDNGVEDLPNAIEQAAKKFSVPKNDLEDAFEDCLNDNADSIGYDDGPQISEGFLGQLDTILTENKSKTVIFENQSAKVVSPNEAQSLVEMYSSLNKSNKDIFKQKLSESKQTFEKMVKFAVENPVMNESIKPGNEGHNIDFFTGHPKSEVALNKAHHQLVKYGYIFKNNKYEHPSGKKIELNYHSEPKSMYGRLASSERTHRTGFHTSEESEYLHTQVPKSVTGFSLSHLSKHLESLHGKK